MSIAARLVALVPTRSREELVVARRVFDHASRDVRAVTRARHISQFLHGTHEDVFVFVAFVFFVGDERVDARRREASQGA